MHEAASSFTSDFTPSLASLSAAIIAGVVAAVGWIAVHLFTSSRDREARRAASEAADRVKRLELLLKQAEAQISQFYGPVHGLIQQIEAIWNVSEKFENEINDEQIHQIKHFLRENYFAPYHEKIRLLMRDNMHLIEGTTLPHSFSEYIKHSMMQNIQIRLWNERKIDTSAIAGIEWPPQFNVDIKNGLINSTNRYYAIMNELNYHSNGDIEKIFFEDYDQIHC
jgi:hypothetical protein